MVAKSENILGSGSTGYVVALDSTTVAKLGCWSDNQYFSDMIAEMMSTEEKIYQRLGPHPQICGYLGPVSGGFKLQRMEGTLRERLSKHEPLPKNLALKWSLQLAIGLAYIHSKGVLQSDFGCHNVLLDNEDNLKLCDFAGSSIDNEPAIVESGDQFQKIFVNDLAAGSELLCELFALGCALYEIWTTNMPYENESKEYIEQMYQIRCFPNVEGLPPASIIKRCWNRSYRNTDDVVKDLEYLASNETSRSIWPTIPRSISLITLSCSMAFACLMAHKSVRPGLLHLIKRFFY